MIFPAPAIISQDGSATAIPLAEMVQLFLRAQQLLHPARLVHGMEMSLLQHNGQREEQTSP